MKKLTVAFLMVVLLSAGVAVANQASRFSDVAGHPQADDIHYATDAGWFSGYKDGTFRPDQEITPKQIATVMVRAFPKGESRADLASILIRGLNKKYKRGEWAVIDKRWDNAGDKAPWAFYAKKSRDECSRPPQLDHMVSVRRANDAGGWKWSVDVKESFYLTPKNLHWMCGEENREKYDYYLHPNWQPNPDAYDQYINAVAEISRTWKLDLDVLTTDAITTTTSTTAPKATTTTTTTTTTITGKGQVCVNTATAEELMNISGIKVELSKRIIQERQVRPFSSLDDLVRVSGIGPSTVKKIKTQGIAAIC